MERKRTDFVNTLSGEAEALYDHARAGEVDTIEKIVTMLSTHLKRENTVDELRLEAVSRRQGKEETTRQYLKDKRRLILSG